MCRNNPQATEQDICWLIPGPRGGEGARLCRCLEAGTFGAGWVRGTDTAVEPACLPNSGSRVSRPLAQSARCPSHVRALCPAGPCDLQSAWVQTSWPSRGQ